MTMTEMPAVAVDLRRRAVQASPRVWQSILRGLVDSGEKALRDRLARKLSDSYEGLNPGSDEENQLVLRVQDADDFRTLQGVVTGLEVQLTDTITENITDNNGDEKAPAKVRVSKPKQGRSCECGCGGTTGGGKWMPGHDAKYKSRLIKAVDNSGDEQAAAEMVERGWWPQERADERLAKHAEAVRLNEQNAARGDEPDPTTDGAGSSPDDGDDESDEFDDEEDEDEDEES